MDPQFLHSDRQGPLGQQDTDFGGVSVLAAAAAGFWLKYLRHKARTRCGGDEHGLT